MAAGTSAARFDNVNLLRAVAALLVVGYHVIELGKWSSFPQEGPLAAFRIGWLGVDLFFVISGFVIGYSALVLYRASPAGFQGAYWSRRLSRILPLYLLTLVAWIAVFWPDFCGLSAQDWAIQLATHLTFTHHFWVPTHGAINGPSWSLGIEMQFYALVALAIGWIDRTPGWRIWLFAILVSWAYRYGAMRYWAGEPGYVLFVKVTQLPGVLDQFAAGIFLAKRVLDGEPARRGEALGWIAAAIASGWLAFTLYWSHAAYWIFPSMVVFWRTLLAFFLLCLVAAAVRLPQSLSQRWLRPVDYLGEVSYGIYLWHMFMLALAIRWVGPDPAGILAMTLAGTGMLAALSWHAFEKPFMRFARR